MRPPYSCVFFSYQSIMCLSRPSGTKCVLTRLFRVAPSYYIRAFEHRDTAHLVHPYPGRPLMRLPGANVAIGPARSRYINVNRGTTKSRWMRHKVDDPEDAYWCKLSRRTLLVKIPRFYILYVTIRIYLSQICIFFERYFAVNNSRLIR